MAVARLETPGGFAVEVRLGPGAEFGYGPTFGGVGAHEDAVGLEAGEVGGLVGYGGGLVPVV